MSRIFGLTDSAQWRDACRFVRNCAVFMLPFCGVFIVNVIVDPFNMRLGSSIPFQKKQIASFFNERLWKLNDFMRNPATRVIVGDSRADRLSQELLCQMTGKQFANVALSGATLVEIIDTFWFVVSTEVPQEIIFCINFDRFNDWQKSQGVADAVSTIRNPLLHYLQPQTCKATAAVLVNHFFYITVVSQKPPMSREHFWQVQLDEIDGGYNRYVFPVYASRQLSDIAQYCKTHAITLSFIILPTHTDLQQRIDHAQLRHEEQKFKEFLLSLAPVYDFDLPNEFTHNKENFDDPKHVSARAVTHVVATVWGTADAQTAHA